MAKKIYVRNNLNTEWIPLATSIPNASAYATYEYVDNELANIDLTSTINTASAAAVTYIVDAAPSTLNTLNELAAALNDDENFASTVSTSLGNKLNTSTASSTYLTQASASTIYALKNNPEFNVPNTISTQDSISYSGLLIGYERTGTTSFSAIIQTESSGPGPNYSVDSQSISLSVDGGSNPISEIPFTLTGAINLDNRWFYGTFTASEDPYYESILDNYFGGNQTWSFSAWSSFESTETLTISGSELKYLDNASSNIQTQLDSKASNNSPTFTGTANFSGASVAGILDVAEVREAVVSNSFSTNVMTANYNDGAIHYATVAPTGNFTINLTNVPTTTSKSITMSFLITQGSTGRIPTTLNLNGSSQTIRWVGGVAPTPTSSAGKIDIFNFTLILAASNVVIASANLNI
jgi:hypothetical protein